LRAHSIDPAPSKKFPNVENNFPTVLLCNIAPDKRVCQAHFRINTGKLLQALSKALQRLQSDNVMSYQHQVLPGQIGERLAQCR